jgi:hypothetical protein
MSTMAIVVAVVGHKKPKLLEKGVVGEVLLAGARESNRNFAGAREFNSLGINISGPFFFLFFSFFRLRRCTWEKSSTCGRALVMLSLMLGYIILPNCKGVHFTSCLAKSQLESQSDVRDISVVI